MTERLYHELSCPSLTKKGACSCAPVIVADGPRRYSIGHGLTYLECPCCGDNGAASDGEGCFYDGQALICGCVGWVSVDEDGDAWINNGDELCPCSR